MSSMLGKNGSNAMQTTRLSGMALQQALQGAVVPVLFGTRRLSLNLIWYGDFKSVKAKQQAGGSGGSLGKGGGTAFIYSASILGLMCEGQTGGIDSIWDQDGMYEVAKITESMVVPSIPPYQITVANNGPALYNRDTGVVQLVNFSVPTNDYGNPDGPGTLTGTQGVPLISTGGSPAAGEYSIDGVGTYHFNAAQAGQSIQVSYAFYVYKLTERELATAPIGGGIVTVQHQPNFAGDVQVQYYPSAVALTRVGGSPGTGEYNPNNGNYEFSAGDGGQAIEISYQWNNPEVDQNAPSTLNMTIIEGTPSQAPWAYLSSSHPTQALGYTGCAMIGAPGLNLGYTPNLPNYSFEVSGPATFGGGIVDACPSDAIQAVLTDPIFGIGMDSKWIDTSLQGLARAYWLSNNFFISDYLNTQSSAASVIGKYCEASLVAPFWSEGLLKFIPAGTATSVANGAIYQPPTNPIVSFDDSDYVVDKGKDPITVTRVEWQNAYNDIRVEWSVRENSYNRDVLPAQDEAAIDMFGRRPEGPKSYQFLCIQDAAQFAANMRLQRFQGVKNSYQTTVKAIYNYLEPMDVVLIADPKMIGTGATIPVRITKTVDDPKKGLVLTMEDIPFTVFNTVLYPKEQAVASNDLTIARSQPDQTVLELIEIPAALVNGNGNSIYLFASGAGTNWGGCDIYYSFDNVTYNWLSTVKTAARTGTLLTTLPATADPDTTDTLKVQMNSPDATLISVPKASADALVTLSALVDASGHLELMSYENVALIGPGQYGMTYLRRGQLSTAVQSFAPGSSFLRMDEASVHYQYAQSYVGETIFFKALSFNQFGLQQQSLPDVSPISIPLSGTTAEFAGNIPTSSPLNPQGSINPTAITVTATLATDPTPKLILTVNSGTIYRPDGSTIPVTGVTANYTTWNSTAVSFPPTPGSGTNYRHFGVNVVYNVQTASLVYQQFGPLDNTSASNPWTAVQGQSAFRDGLIQILIEGDAFLSVAAGGATGGGGGGGRACPIEGTEIVPLGKDAFARPFENTEWVKLVLEDGKELTATPDHPVYTDRGKTKIKDVRVGEEVVTKDGMVKAVSVTRELILANAMAVTMSTGHLYWAGGILSHNIKSNTL